MRTLANNRVVFPTDEHYPFQDERARKVALQITADFDPGLRVAGSDGLDFYNISKYDKDPARMKVITLQYAIEQWQAGQREWQDASPNAVVFFLIGNHEDRLRRYLWRNPELFDLEVLRLPSLLGFAKLGIPWGGSEDEHKELDVDGRLLITHGDIVRKYSAYTAKAVLEKEHYARSVMVGHTHRGGTHLTQTRNGLVQGQECFCLCSLSPDYVLHPDWQHGLVLAEVENGIVSIEAVPFHHIAGKVVARWREKEYTS